MTTSLPVRNPGAGTSLSTRAVLGTYDLHWEDAETLRWEDGSALSWDTGPSIVALPTRSAGAATTLSVRS